MYIDLGDTKVNEEIDVTDEHLEFLDNLRDSSATNMFGAGPYLEEAFNISGREATYILQQWMETYGERHAV